jgi:hypothetical protein
MALLPLLDDYLHVQKENVQLQVVNKNLQQDNIDLRKVRQVSFLVALKDAFTDPSNKNSTVASKNFQTKF